MSHDTVPDFISFPKVELHVHLDCSLTQSALARLGHPVDDEEFARTYSAPERCGALSDYLRAIAPSCAILQTAEALEVATEELVLALSRDGVIHAEIRFAPHTHRSQGLSLDQVVEAVTLGLTRGRDATGMSLGLILCALRDYPPEANRAVIDLAHRWRDRGVVGVDLAGDEVRHSSAANREVFDRAHALDLPVTTHAGESAGPESIAEVIDLLRPVRIGHGVRAIESEEIMARIKDLELHLEVCPSSNIQVGVFADLAHHPVDRLSRRGISLSINTDSRTVASLSLSLEYTRLAQCFGWAQGEFLAHNLEAARRSFLPDAVRAQLQARLIDDWSA